jgi:hypothetical protein
MEYHIREDYKRYCRDGSISTKEVRECVFAHGGRIDDYTCTQLLTTIAGADRRITEDEFTFEILNFLFKSQPVPYGLFPNSSEPFDPYRARDVLHQFYSEAAGDNVVETREVRSAVFKFGLPCEASKAQELILMIAGPERRITRAKFVETLLGYICQMHRVAVPPPQSPSYAAAPPPPSYSAPVQPPSYSAPPSYAPPPPSAPVIGPAATQPHPELNSWLGQ